MATIKDVAKLAGVALSTASYALSGDSKVSAKTKAKVLEAKTRTELPQERLCHGPETEPDKHDRFDPDRSVGPVLLGVDP